MFVLSIIILNLILLSDQARGQSLNGRIHQLKKWQKRADGKTEIDLYEGGPPTMVCQMFPGKGPANPRHCADGGTTITVVDAPCSDSKTEKSHPSCFAASITHENGSIFIVNRDGKVKRREQTEYPPEEDPPNENDDPSLWSDLRRSLRGSDATSASHRSLQGTPIIDVLVVYTQGAKNDALTYQDGPIVDLINLAISETNQAYINSEINLELRLAGGEPHEDTSYTEDQGSTSMLPSLQHITYSAGSTDDPNGLLDYVHDLRASTKADMVALITTGAGCGIAWLSGNCVGCNPSKAWMFSVTQYSCATGYYSFGHELGHNQGANHDKGTSNTCGSTDYRYGYRDPQGQYRSILAYACATGQCDNNPGGPCTRSQFFSNPAPHLTWNNGPMGHSATSSIGETNNAKKISLSAPVIAGFYDASNCVVDADCDDGIYCNGVETCSSGTCQAGTPVACDDGLFCNGLETCNESTQSCQSGTPPVCDDGLFCNGVETCNEETNSCVAGTPLSCDDGLFCNGVETCSESTQSCVPGTAVNCDDGNPLTCPETCSEALFGSCVLEENPSNCCGNGICEVGETCNTCPEDCLGGSSPGSVCGNGVCETGEDCNSCPADCNGRTGGKPALRYCCSGGPSGTCSDNKCNANGNTCSPDPTQSSEWCCGDGTCTAGFEDASICPLPECAGVTPAPTSAPVTSPPVNCQSPNDEASCTLCSGTWRCNKRGCKCNL